MNKALIIAQALIAVVLIGLILLQQRGAGMSDSIAGRIGTITTRRGAEKFIFISTVIVAILFLIIPLVRLVIK